jgi:hypothetical protein
VTIGYIPRFAVIGDPCPGSEAAGPLDLAFTSPFDGRAYTIAERAPSVRCTADGQLAGATRRRR